MKQWSRRLGGTLQKITSGRKRSFVFSKWIIFFLIYTGDRCVQSRRCFAGPKVEVCGIPLHERTAFYQQLFSGFLFLFGWWRWGELFSPQAAQLGLACWQRTGDSSNFLIQHFSDASWRNPHPGSASPFFVVSFLQTLVCWGGARYIAGSADAVHSQDRASSEKRLNKPCGQTPHSLELPAANLAAAIFLLVPGQSSPMPDQESFQLRLLMSQITQNLDP